MNRSSARECLAPGTVSPPARCWWRPRSATPRTAGCTARPRRWSGGCCTAGACASGTRRCRTTTTPGPTMALSYSSPPAQRTARPPLGAAAAADRVAMAAARSAVEEWAAVGGTRRLLGAVSPWCPGARRALEATRQALARGPVYVCGQLMASPQACADLEKNGAVFARSLADVPDGATVLFPAHGVAPGVRAEAAARGLEVIDATCPLVARTHAEARKLADRGDDVVLIGQSGIAVVPGIAGEAPGRHPGQTRVGAGAAGHGLPAGLLPAGARYPGGGHADRDRGAEVTVPGAARPAPGRVLLRRVRPGGDDPDRGRVLRRDPRAGHRGLPGHPAALRAGAPTGPRPT